MIAEPPQPLWSPAADAMRRTRLGEFIELARPRWPQITDYDSLYRWSVEQPQGFWGLVWEYCGVTASRGWQQVLQGGELMPGARWFVGARLNFAENLLRYRDAHTALICRTEGGEETRLSYAELFQQVAGCAAQLRRLGVGPGDRVAGLMANNAAAVVAMLASASVGAIWSSCSPEFGLAGVLERFAQITPKVLFAVDGYRYDGKAIDVRDTVAEVARAIDSIEQVVVVPFLDAELTPSAVASIRNCTLFDAAFLAAAPAGAAEMEFAQLPFAHPLYILYSSGTTGAPKCIVHSAGGTLVQHLKEHQLHTDLRRSDVLFYFTTCGWMMWNWLVSGLASGCTLVLYDGSPFYPRADSLWQMAAEVKISVFGTSARYLAAAAKAALKPMQTFDLAALRAILSTGSPLVAEQFDYVYAHIKSEVMLSSISGGTDIVSCFVLGNPLRAVYRGEVQGAGLGMAVAVFDEAGRAVVGQRGELVCTRAFPSMPLGLWNNVGSNAGSDGGDVAANLADDARYRAAYFARFPGVWAQGDYAEITPRDGIVIYGRSDAVLNPAGVRIGTAEIYRQVEKVDAVLESVCIGQRWQGDVRVVLFVRLRPAVVLDAALKQQLCQTIQAHTTRRHVPAKIIAVADIPRTLSGKVVELAVRNVVHGEAVNNTAALANPQALEYFRNLEELEY